jgi:hypothetical protein
MWVTLPHKDARHPALEFNIIRGIYEILTERQTMERIGALTPQAPESRPPHKWVWSAHDLKFLIELSFDRFSTNQHEITCLHEPPIAEGFHAKDTVITITILM